MYLKNKEHNLPRIHAITSEYDAPFSIDTSENMEGDFPNKGRLLVK